MGFKCGIIGLPNVGKSTLFNALTQTSIAQAENYPFCTIEPNVGEVDVPDNRLFRLSNISSSKKIIHTRITFVDIAGLVEGASKGEGLGNQFLGNIREVDALVHIVRCFENENITHVNGFVDPIRDIETINQMSADSTKQFGVFKIYGPDGSVVPNKNAHKELLSSWFEAENPTWRTYFSYTMKLDGQNGEWVISGAEVKKTVDGNEVTTYDVARYVPSIYWHTQYESHALR